MAQPMEATSSQSPPLAGASPQESTFQEVLALLQKGKSLEAIGQVLAIDQGSLRRLLTSHGVPWRVEFNVKYLGGDNRLPPLKFSERLFGGRQGFVSLSSEGNLDLSVTSVWSGENQRV